MSSYGERVRTLLEHGTVICECHTCMGSDGTAVLRILWDDGHISETPYYKVVPSDKPGRPLFNGQPATDVERREYRSIPFKHLHGWYDATYLPDPLPRHTSPLTLP